MLTHGTVAGQQPAPAQSEQPAQSNVDTKTETGPRAEFLKVLDDYSLILPFQFKSRLEGLIDKYFPKG